MTIKELNSLISLIIEHEKNYSEKEGLLIPLDYRKRILEIIGVPHKIEDNNLLLDPDHSYSLINTLKENLPNSNSTLTALNKISDIEIKNKAPVYIGTRVGRPEKSKERLMKPAPHSLFPIGNYGGSRRLIASAAKKGNIKIDLPTLWGSNKNRKTWK